jgi:hypothetical protein
MRKVWKERYLDDYGGLIMEPNKIYILHDIGKTELTPEEAKEQLSEVELPPNMKKIIEGMDEGE